MATDNGRGRSRGSRPEEPDKSGSASANARDAADAASAGIDKTKSAISDTASSASGAVSGAGKKAAGIAGATAGGARAVSGSASTAASTSGSSRTKTVTATTRETRAVGRKVTGRANYLTPNRAGKVPWRKRWLGLLPIAALAGFGGWWAWDHMEDNLHERAVIHLACEGIDADTLDLDWSYRDATVEGQLPAGVSADRVKQIIDQGSDDADCLDRNGIDADDDPGVYDVNVAGLAAAAVPVPDPTPVPTATAVPEPTATPEPEPTATAIPEPTAAPAPTATPRPEPTEVPVAVPLDTTAKYDGNVITLAGFVGSEAQRNALVEAAQSAVGADRVVDELEIDESGFGEDNDALVANLAELVGHFGSELVEGDARINDDSLTYHVRAGSQGASDALALEGSGTVDVSEAPSPTFTG